MPKFKRISAGSHEVTVDGAVITLTRGDPDNPRKCGGAWTLRFPEGRIFTTVPTIWAANGILEFTLLAEKFLRESGATYSKSLLQWKLETTLGELQVTINDSWMAMRFKDVARAKTRFGPGDMNQSTGQWTINWHTMAMAGSRFHYFRQKLESILVKKAA